MKEEEVKDQERNEDEEPRLRVSDGDEQTHATSDARQKLIEHVVDARVHDIDVVGEAIEDAAERVSVEELHRVEDHAICQAVMVVIGAFFHAGDPGQDAADEEKTGEET